MEAHVLWKGGSLDDKKGVGDGGINLWLFRSGGVIPTALIILENHSSLGFPSFSLKIYSATCTHFGVKFGPLFGPGAGPQINPKGSILHPSGRHRFSRHSVSAPIEGCFLPIGWQADFSISLGLCFPADIGQDGF